MGNIKNNMSNEEINDMIKKYEYLIFKNIDRYFYNFCRINNAYDDMVNEGRFGMWLGILDYKDIEKDNEYSRKCYLSRCCYTKMSNYTKLNRHKKEDAKSLRDVVMTDREGNVTRIEDIYRCEDDNTDIIAKQLINTYDGIYKDIMELLYKGYNMAEISRELGVNYSTLNLRMDEIRENLNIKIGLERPGEYRCKKKIKAIGVGWYYEEVFDKLTDAENELGINYNSIRKICQGLRKRAKSKVYNKKVTFEYV